MHRIRKTDTCERCIGGKLMAFGDEVTCINCGWSAPVPDPVSPYRRLVLAQF